jgi:hypothetical protein
MSIGCWKTELSPVNRASVKENAWGNYAVHESCKRILEYMQEIRVLILLRNCLFLHILDIIDVVYFLYMNSTVSECISLPFTISSIAVVD